MTRIPVDKKVLAAFCLRNHIRTLSFFGSVLRENFRADSDVDILVDFEPGETVGFIRMAGLERELSSILGRKVDLRTPPELSRYFREEVIRQSEIAYARA